MAAGSANGGRHHRRSRPGPAGGGVQRQPVRRGLRRLIECGRVSELPVGGRLLRTACAPTACRTIPTPAAAERSRSPTRRHSGSAAPSSVRPSEPASTCSRPPADRSPPIAPAMRPAGVCPQALVQHALTACGSTPGACAPTGCRTGPTPPSIPRGALFSMSPYRAHLRRRSAARLTNASACGTQARCWHGVETKSGIAAPNPPTRAPWPR